MRCARVAAQLGANVAIAENRYLGGTCVNVGCVPKKMLVYASQFSHEFVAAKGFGWRIDAGDIDWQKLIKKKNTEITRLNGIYGNLLKNAGATLISGTATIVGPDIVAVNEKQFRCKNIVVAVGGWPKQSNYPGAEYSLTSNEMFQLPQLPKRILIEGGGYIAVEFAGIFNGLGCNTELMYRGPLFLRGFEESIRQHLASAYQQNGMKLSFNASIVKITKNANGTFRVTDSDNNEREVDAVLSAIGRRPMTDGLGLDALGVKTHRDGTVEVDQNFATNVPGIYALGDAVGRMPLTPVALQEGMALANYLFKQTPIDMNYDFIPTAVFSQPEIATVGLTKVQAEQKYGEVDVYTSAFKPLKHTISELNEKTLMTMVVDKKTQRVVGCHMIGDHAAEIMQGIAVAINMGATKKDFDKTVGIHPSAAEEWVTMR